jgi:cold shock CspA family protein
MPVGRVKFFKKDDGFWGIITCSDFRDLFFHGSKLQEGPQIGKNQWVDFLVSTKNDKPCAVNIVPIECPPEYLFRGRVGRFYPDRGFGFIRYEAGEIFFHLSDVLLIDGVEYAPVKDCVVEFYIGQKTNRNEAVNIAIREWPEPEQSIEDYFEQAPELQVDIPEPQPVAEPSVLSPETKNKSLLEIIRERRR